MPFPSISTKTLISHRVIKSKNPPRTLSPRSAPMFKLLTIPLKKRKSDVHVKKLSASRCIANALLRRKNVGRTVPAYPVKITMNSKKTSMRPRPASRKEAFVIVVYLKKDAIVKNHIV